MTSLCGRTQPGDTPHMNGFDASEFPYSPTNGSVGCIIEESENAPPFFSPLHMFINCGRDCWVVVAPQNSKLSFHQLAFH